MGHAIELQNAHTREQMESFPRQLAEVRDLALPDRRYAAEGLKVVQFA